MDYEKMELVLRDGKGFLRPRIDQPVIQEPVEPVAEPKKPEYKRPLNTLLEVVSERLGIPEEEIRGPSRKRSHAHARFIVAMIAHDDFRMSLTTISRYLDDRDHTTILHGVRVARQGSIITESEHQAILEEVWRRRTEVTWQD